MSDGELNIDDAFALFDLITGIDVKGKNGKAVTKVDGKDSAKNVANYDKLKKDLASQEQLSEINNGNFKVIAGKEAENGKKIDDINRLINQYGGKVEDWAKVKSTNRDLGKGIQQETHAYVNVKTGKVYEPKTKIIESKIQ